MPHTNITRDRTKYPAPSAFYGDGWFYDETEAEAADKARWKKRGPEDAHTAEELRAMIAKPAVKVQPVVRSSNKAAEDPLKPRKCPDCGEMYRPRITAQNRCKPCAAVHKRAENNRLRREKRAGNSRKS